MEAWTPTTPSNGGGAAWALPAITGKPASDYSINPTNIAAAWKAGDLIVLAPPTVQFLLVADHCYAVVGYNAASSPVSSCSTRGAATLRGGRGPRQHQQDPGPVSANAAFIAQNFSTQSIGTGAPMETPSTGGRGATGLAALGGDSDPSGMIHSSRHGLTGSVVGAQASSMHLSPA